MYVVIHRRVEFSCFRGWGLSDQNVIDADLK